MTDKERIIKIKNNVEENGAFSHSGTSMNIYILEDTYESIEDEILWLINHSQKQASIIEKLEKELQSKN